MHASDAVRASRVAIECAPVRRNWRAAPARKTAAEEKQRTGMVETSNEGTGGRCSCSARSPSVRRFSRSSRSIRRRLNPRFSSFVRGLIGLFAVLAAPQDDRPAGVPAETPDAPPRES